jgi:DNA polymerase-3 subunit delta
VAHPIVLIAGGEEFLAEREVRRILNAVRTVEPTLERRDIDGSSDNAFETFVDSISPSLFGQTPLVVVDNIEQASDSLQAAVLNAIADPETQTRALLVQKGLVKGRGFIDKIKKSDAEVILVEKPKGKAFDEFIINEFKTYKRKVDAAAVKSLRDAVGDDLRMLSAAVSQLSSDLDSPTIMAADVEQYYEGMSGVPAYVITDHVFERRVTQAITALRWGVEREPNMGPAVIATAMNVIRSLLHVVNAPSGSSEADIARMAGVPPWKVRTLRDQARKWRPAELADAALLLTYADAALKGGHIDELGAVEVLDPIQRAALLERVLVEMAQVSK